jgi:hypothetical protein
MELLSFSSPPPYFGREFGLWAEATISPGNPARNRLAVRKNGWNGMAIVLPAMTALRLLWREIRVITGEGPRPVEATGHFRNECSANVCSAYRRNMRSSSTATLRSKPH